MAIRERTKHNIWTKWRDAPPSHFTRVWRKNFSKSIHNLNRGNLRKATMFLTGHVTLNYHLNKYKPDKISKTCPHCLAVEETTNHYIGQCPKWSAQRSAVFDSFYLSISEVVDYFSIFVIMKYINATGRLNPISTRSSGFTPSSSIRSHYKFQGVGKGRPRPKPHVLSGRSPLQS